MFVCSSQSFEVLFERVVDIVVLSEMSAPMATGPTLYTHVQ